MRVQHGSFLFQGDLAHPHDTLIRRFFPFCLLILGFGSVSTMVQSRRYYFYMA